MLRLRRSRSGTSVIEVLVMMVVLLIGIMTIVRMFPGGFFVLRRAESQTFAARLAQAEIERWKLHATNLPAGILPVDDNGEVQLEMDPGPPFNRGSYTNDERVLGWRRVIGESVKIPVAGEVGTEAEKKIYGSIYLLGFSPINAVTNPSGEITNVKVYSSPLRRFVRDSDTEEPWEWLPQTAYAIDYSNDERNPKITFAPAPFERVYVISYAWWERPTSEPNEKPTLQTTTEQIIVPPNTEQWLDVPCRGSPSMTAYAGSGIEVFGMDDRSETVSRGFTQLATSTAWSNDPYEYKILDVVTGILVFNPYGYGYTEQTPQGVRPLVARIDYDILDPGILREDKTVSIDAPYTLKLTLNYIIQDQSLKAGYLDQNLLLVDPVDGSKIPVVGNDIVLPPPHDPVHGMLQVDYKSGTITFLNTVIPAVDLSQAVVDKNIIGRAFRVYYRADGDWVVQVLKPFEAYDRQDDAGIDYRHYHLAQSRYLYFPVCDAGKSVSVDLTWVERIGSNRVQHPIVGEDYQISEDTLAIGAFRWCYVDLQSKHPEIANRALDEPLNIRGVWGTSLKVRVFWRDGPGAPWHFAESSTSLQKKPEDV